VGAAVGWRRRARTGGEQVADDGRVVVADGRADEPGAEVLVEREVDDGVAVGGAALARDVVDVAPDEVAVALVHDVAHHEATGTEPTVGPLRQRVHLGDQRLALVGDGGQLLGAVADRRDLPPRRHREQHQAALVEREADVDRTGLHLRPHGGAAARAASTAADHHAHHALVVGVGVEQRRQRGGDAVAQRQVGELLDAGDREVGVEELVDDLQHGVALAEHGRQRVELLGPAQRLGTGRYVSSMSTKLVLTGRRPRRRGRRAAGRTSPDLVGGGGAAPARRAHHEHAQHRVADERRDVQRDVAGERVEPAAEASRPSASRRRRRTPLRASPR
jgi:hypothetical protein